MPADPGQSTAREDLSKKFRRLVDVGLALTSERDLPTLLGLILREARRFTSADAGTLYLVTKAGKLRFSVVQNDSLGHSEVFAGSGSRPLDMEISSTSIAGCVSSSGSVLNIPDVYALPEGCGYKFDRSFDEKTGYRSRSMLVVPMKKTDGKVVGVIQLINAVCPETGEPALFPADQEELALSLASQAAAALTNVQLAEDLHHSYVEAIHHLAKAAEYRDKDTGHHIERVSRYAAAIAAAMGFSQEYVSDIQLAATLHDIGKLAIPDRILQKPGKLTSEEFEEMKAHSVIGADLLSGSENRMLQMAAEIALSHHERWDGSGYPRGLQSEEIPISGQICAVADVFDALCSARCYKDAFEIGDACYIIRQGSGRHFSPKVVDVFFLILDKIMEIRKEFTEF